MNAKKRDEDRKNVLSCSRPFLPFLLLSSIPVALAAPSNLSRAFRVTARPSVHVISFVYVVPPSPRHSRSSAGCRKHLEGRRTGSIAVCSKRTPSKLLKKTSEKEVVPISYSSLRNFHRHLLSCEYGLCARGVPQVG